MSDSLSHSCPTCEGRDKPGCSCGACGIAGGRGYAWCHNNTGCPDCIDGYPKVAVERAAKAIEDTVKAHVMPSRLTGGEVAPGMFFGATMQELALAAIRAFHNEESET